MRRQIAGLSNTVAAADEVPDGLYLVRVQRAQYRWHKQKPSYALTFYVLQPRAVAGGSISARLICATKVLWKFGWFLRDFRYSPELLERDEIDERAMVGLCGVIRISHEMLNGRSTVKLDAFAPECDWELLLGINDLKPEVA
jgi:hypothetical protein